MSAWFKNRCRFANEYINQCANAGKEYIREKKENGQKIAEIMLWNALFSKGEVSQKIIEDYLNLRYNNTYKNSGNYIQ